VTNTDEYGREGASSKDIEVIRAYGSTHADEWVEVWADRQPDFTLIASFYDDDVSRYERELRQLVSRPDRLQVRRSPWPLSHLEKIRDDIFLYATSLRPKSVFTTLGIGRGIVMVRLSADQEEYAAHLRHLYGDAIDIMVGSFHFPDMGPDPWLARVTRPAVAPSPLELALPPFVVASLEHEVSVVSGQNTRTKLLLRNTGTDDLVLNTNGMVTASVVEPATGERVGGFAGAQTVPLVRFQLAGGASVSVPMLIGTTSTKSELGYCVPAGAWAITVILNFEGMDPCITPLLPLMVLAREVAGD